MSLGGKRRRLQLDPSSATQKFRIGQMSFDGKARLRDASSASSSFCLWPVSFAGKARLQRTLSPVTSRTGSVSNRFLDDRPTSRGSADEYPITAAHRFFLAELFVQVVGSDRV